MTLEHDITSGIDRLVKKKFGSYNKMCREFGIKQATLSKFCTGANSGYKFVAEILDKLGVRLLWPDQVSETKRPVIMNAPKETPEGFAISNRTRAIPILPIDEVSDFGAMDAVNITDWCLLEGNISTLLNRNNLVAVRLDRDQRHLGHLIRPGDLVVVDREDKSVNEDRDGNIFLVKDPWDGFAIKRATLRQQNENFILLFYSDSGEFPPSTIDINDLGEDIQQAVVGRIVHARIDMTKK